MRIQATRAAILFAALLAACHKPPPDGPAPVDALVGKEWLLVELNGKMAPTTADRRHASLLLTPEGSAVSGFTGCNQFTGSYTLAGGSLTFGPLAMTKMFCQNTQALEDEYTKALAATTAQRMVNGRLELLAGTTMVARFKR